MIYDPIAGAFSKQLGKVTVQGPGKVNASNPSRIGVFEFNDPRALVDYMARVDPHMTLQNVMIVEGQDSGQQKLIVDNIDTLLKNKIERFKLLVVDSPVTHYRSEYIGRAMLPGGSKNFTGLSVDYSR
jgi:Rad51